MRNRNILLLVALVVLIGVYWLMRENEPVVKADRPFVTADSAKVDLMRVETSEETVELRQEEGIWWVVQPVRYPAAPGAVQSAIQKLQEMKKLSLITERPDRFDDFQVADSGATRITVGQAGNATSFILGKPGPTLQTSYARLTSSKEVWEIAGNHTGTFRKKAKDWRDKTITDLDMNAISKVVVEYPGQTMTIALEDTAWIVYTAKEQFVTERDLVERLTRMISRISAVDFVDTLSNAAFANPEARIIASLGTGGEPVELKLIPKDEEGNQYFLRKEGAPADFVIYKSTANALMKKPEELKPKKATSGS